MLAASLIHDLQLFSYFVKNKGMDMKGKLSVDSQSNSGENAMEIFLTQTCFVK
jgi:hypothetical protein